MRKILWFVFGFTVIFSGCSERGVRNDSEPITLTLGAYTVPKEVYQQELIPRFQRIWKEKTGQAVYFEQSYMASGAQSRTIATGFEADIAALSLEKDVERLRDKGLITHDWKGRNGGFITRSVVVIVVRPQNPKRIRGWEDLTRPDVNVIYPSPKTSGGAMWIVNAIYGSRLRETEAEQGGPDETAAEKFLAGVQARVKVMNKSGRASVTTFENGIGDVLLTYENEAILRKKQNKDFPFIIPSSTILIENPVAVVDANVEKHGNRDVAEAFLGFLHSAEAQRCFARFGFRPVHPDVAKEFKEEYPEPEMLFDVRYLGGWNSISNKLYGKSGIWTKIFSGEVNGG